MSADDFPPGDPLDRTFTSGELLAPPPAPGTEPGPAAESPGPGASGPSASNAPRHPSEPPPVADAPPSPPVGDRVAAEPVPVRRGPPRDEIELDRPPRAGEAVLPCPSCNVELNGSVLRNRNRPLGHGSRFDCPGCSTTLRLDLIAGEHGATWHLARRPEAPRPDLRPSEHRRAAAMILGWLRDPGRDTSEVFGDRFAREHPDLRPWEVLFGVYDIEDAGTDHGRRQRRVKPGLVPLQRYRAERRRAAGLPVRPDNGVYPLDELLEALTPPAPGWTCGDCRRALHTEQTDGELRLTCPRRRHPDSGCFGKSTRRRKRVQLAVQEAAEQALTDDELLYDLYPVWLDALYLGLPELAARGVLPPLYPHTEPTDEEQAEIDEWGDEPGSVEESERLECLWHEGRLPRPDASPPPGDYAAEWLAHLQAINQSGVPQDEKSAQRRALERAQGASILEVRAQRLPCRRDFLWFAHCQAERLAQCRIPPEQLTDLVQQVIISEVRAPDDAGRVWQAEVIFRRSALVRLLLPGGQQWPLPDGTETLTVSVDGRSSAEEQADDVRVLHNAGETQEQIGDLLGLSQPTVSRILQSPAPERTPSSDDHGIPDADPMEAGHLAMQHLSRPAVRLKCDPWKRPSDTVQRNHLKKAVERFRHNDDTHPDLRPWPIERRLRAGDERDVDGDAYGDHHGRTVEPGPQDWRTREPRPHLTIGVDDQLVREIAVMIPLLYARDESLPAPFPSADSAWQAAQALAFDGDPRGMGSGARKQAIRAAAQEIQAIDRGDLAPGSPLLIALAIWSHDTFERTLIEALAAAGIESRRIADCLGYSIRVIDYVRHLFDPGPRFLDPRRRTGDSDQAAAIQQTVRTFLLNVAARDPGRLVRLLAAWAELELIPRSCRYELPDPRLSEGELLNADVLFQALFLTPTKENVQFIAECQRTIERIQRQRVRAADSRTAPEDELERKILDSLKVMTPGLRKWMPETLSDSTFPQDFFESGPGSQPVSGTGPAVDRFWRPIPTGNESTPPPSPPGAHDRPPVTDVNKNHRDFGPPPPFPEPAEQSLGSSTPHPGGQPPDPVPSG